MDLPRQIGPYRVERLLGYGGLGVVLLCVAQGPSGFERRVAIKMLLPELVGDGDAERVLVDEALLAARMQHRNLIGVEELGVARGQTWIRMEYIAGVDLAALLSHGPLPPPLALLIAQELSLALCYLHAMTDAQGRSLGLVHRDVSPANVMISHHGEVKLGDFGIAKATLLAEVTRAGVRKGKHCYMSPEQVASARLTAASDQFSLAITLVEMLTGRRPYDAESPLLTMEAIREAAPPALDGVAPGVAAVVRRCLSRAPGDRYARTEELYDALRSARAEVGDASPLDLARAVAAPSGPVG